jgi:hypothetical protein
MEVGAQIKFNAEAMLPSYRVVFGKYVVLIVEYG